MGYLLYGPKRWMVDRGSIYTERLFGEAMKKTDKHCFSYCEFLERLRSLFLFSICFMVWPVLWCSRTRYAASILLALDLA